MARRACAACRGGCSSAPRSSRPSRSASIWNATSWRSFRSSTGRSERQPTPSAAAYERLNRFLRSGGMILFDTRDADMAGFGGATPAGRRLQAHRAPLDIPPLEPVPPDHVLTRTFYLLQDFPGRHTGRTVWVEAAPPDAEQVEGMPFRNLNDGVTPVVIGGNDWAAAWATDDRGMPMLPIGRGFAGERQREIALSLRHQPGDACADRQLQIRSGACARAAGKAGAMTGGAVIFDPLLPGRGLDRGGLALLLLALALWRGLSGWWLRALAARRFCWRARQPVAADRGRAPLSDIVLVVVDESASQRISDRARTDRGGGAHLRERIGALDNTELRADRHRRRRGQHRHPRHDRAAEALAEEPRARIAGAVLVSDGRSTTWTFRPRCPRRCTCC
jgi:hypothetical protein